MQQTEEKGCENCRHFIHHYVKMNTKFFMTSCGHCTHPKSPNYKKKTVPKIACLLWETEEIRKIERKRFARNLLLEMADHLEKLCTVLESDEEESNLSPELRIL